MSTDRILPIDEVFDTSTTALEHAFKALEDPQSIVAILEALLTARRPPRDPTAAKVAAMVRVIEATPDLYAVSRLAGLTGKTTRSLQRLFDVYVGAGPKWVIDRYRMIQALEELNDGGETSLTKLAHDLGYFDQAHFTRAFPGLTAPRLRLTGGDKCDWVTACADSMGLKDSRLRRRGSRG